MLGRKLQIAAGHNADDFVVVIHYRKMVQVFIVHDVERAKVNRIALDGRRCR
jgi:hypothetical protein